MDGANIKKKHFEKVKSTQTRKCTQILRWAHINLHLLELFTENE